MDNLLPPCSVQYVTTALREQGARTLDCLGIATVVLALCQQLGQEQQQGGAVGNSSGSAAGAPSLSDSHLMVSDDHCWVTLAPGGNLEDKQVVHVEVTSCK
jgi:hypothetical protein